MVLLRKCFACKLSEKFQEQLCLGWVMSLATAGIPRQGTGDRGTYPCLV